MDKSLKEMNVGDLKEAAKAYQREYDALLDAKTNKELVALVFAKQLTGKAKALHEHLDIMHELWIKEMVALERNRLL